MVNGFHSKESVTLIYFLPLSVHLTCASAFQVFDAFQVADAGFENETRSMLTKCRWQLWVSDSTFKIPYAG